MPSYRAAASVTVAAGAVAVFFVAADFFTGALFAAFAAGAFTWAFLMATFFGPGAAFLAAALAFAALAALAFFRFATSLAFAAAESFRFGLGAGAGADGSAAFFVRGVAPWLLSEQPSADATASSWRR